jgi:glycosyltransferase involved in cell wall biosynthesis
MHVVQPTTHGVARFVSLVATHQLEAGSDVSVACPTPSPLATELLAAGVRVIDWSAVRSPAQGVRSETRRLQAILRRHAPDLLHLQSSKAGLVGRLAARGQITTVFSPNGWSFLAVRGPTRSLAQAWESHGCRTTHAIHCVSSAEMALAPRAGRRIAHVVHNGLEIGRWPVPSRDDAERSRALLGLGGRPTVCCVGRISRQKGQDVLLEAWPTIVGKVPDAVLVLVGANDWPLQTDDPSVRLVGERPDVWEILAATDVYVQPSRWEGHSFAVLEAMATGRSIVAAKDAQGVVEALGESYPGAVSLDAASIADAVIERLLDRELRATEGRLLRERVETRFSARSTCEGLLGVYEEARREAAR